MVTIWGIDMNTMLQVLLELLAAAPAVAKDLPADVEAWHASHGWIGKTAAAAATAGQLAEALSKIAAAQPPTGG
jgi:hypothetical protein